VRFPYLLILLFSHLPGYGQNLIPNGNFEQHSKEFEEELQSIRASPHHGGGGWGHGYSRDLLCWNKYSTAEPLCYGLENTDTLYSRGVLVLYDAAIHNYRTYFQAKLCDTLRKGVTYHFRMKCRMIQSVQFTTNALMIGIQRDSVLLKDKSVQPVFADLRFPAGEWIPQDGWFEITADYVAQGGEQFILLGNFSYDAGTRLKRLARKNASPEAYTEIDDVMLYSGSDCLPCK